jgi:hypothetical protein
MCVRAVVDVLIAVAEHPTADHEAALNFLPVGLVGAPGRVFTVASSPYASNDDMALSIAFRGVGDRASIYDQTFTPDCAIA